MSAHASPAPTSALSAKALGALAVAGVVIAFSLSSTLVKRAHTPGALLAFWRMAVVSVVWNVYLRATGRHITMRHVRYAFIPGVFFGLNLATFFAGATNNSTPVRADRIRRAGPRAVQCLPRAATHRYAATCSA